MGAVASVLVWPATDMPSTSKPKPSARASSTAGRAGTRQAPSTGSIGISLEALSVLGSFVFVVLVAFAYWRIRNREPKRRRIHNAASAGLQDDEVAQVDLTARYGSAMQKRAVKIEDLDTETLLLLKRDGKLNEATVQRLEELGKLPFGEGSRPAPSRSSPTPDSPEPVSAPAEPPAAQSRTRSRRTPAGSEKSDATSGSASGSASGAQESQRKPRIIKKVPKIPTELQKQQLLKQQ
ncbi:uncharacterized protein BJ171DRAFT_601937 [Polychytrium aggregatum]|uniref:uncharacterized protein n=1 Tax=Polychytrium aggregatum TaxID=110093 RepID=UPI0022FE2C6A|nr:uncharacterized protein BJ171DRAFT_601937 [Polychytrium aggregatum]KAI9199360.1 hypothetical protein BJ171DRAFT_601937 [Polychytrium aggregatum]